MGDFSSGNDNKRYVYVNKNYKSLRRANGKGTWVDFLIGFNPVIAGAQLLEGVGDGIRSGQYGQAMLPVLLESTPIGRSLGSMVNKVFGGFKKPKRVDRDSSSSSANQRESGQDNDGLRVEENSGSVESGGSGTSVNSQVLEARQRQHSMLDDNVGFNISPTTWDNYPTIGRNGTFISDRQGITDIIGDFPGQPQLTLDRSKTLQLEEAFGLDTGTLLDGFKIRRVENIVEQMPRSPLEGNQLFRGPGNHLPGGAPEMVIDSIPTVDSSNVSTLFEVLVK